MVRFVDKRNDFLRFCCHQLSNLKEANEAYTGCILNLQSRQEKKTESSALYNIFHGYYFRSSIVEIRHWPLIEIHGTIQCPYVENVSPPLAADRIGRILLLPLSPALSLPDPFFFVVLVSDAINDPSRYHSLPNDSVRMTEPELIVPIVLSNSNGV